MEFRQLEMLKLIVETGSFSLTAKKLGVTQPSISTQISALEKELHSLLLIRQSGKAILTEVGKEFYAYAVEILDLKSKAITTCTQKQKLSGSLNIVASSIPYYFLLPVLTAQFSMQNTEVDFQLQKSDSLGVYKIIEENKAHIGIAGMASTSKDILCEPILEDELMVITPKIMPYTSWKKNALFAKDIVQAPLVAREEGSGTWSEVCDYFKRQGYTQNQLHISAQLQHQDEILKAVEQGVGISLLSSLAATEYSRMANILAFPLADNKVKRKIYVVYNKKNIDSPLVHAFINFILRKDIRK